VSHSGKPLFLKLDFILNTVDRSLKYKEHISIDLDLTRQLTKMLPFLPNLRSVRNFLPLDAVFLEALNAHGGFHVLYSCNDEQSILALKQYHSLQTTTEAFRQLVLIGIEFKTRENPEEQLIQLLEMGADINTIWFSLDDIPEMTRLFNKFKWNVVHNLEVLTIDRASIQEVEYFRNFLARIMDDWTETKITISTPEGGNACSAWGLPLVDELISYDGFVNTKGERVECAGVMDYEMCYQNGL
jgi:hypothetical protein